MAIVDFYGNTIRLGSSVSRAVDKTSLISGVATGTSAAEAFNIGGANTLVGGAGDDRYYQVSRDTKIIEKAGEGIDTVYVVTNYVMPDHVDNLEIGYADGVIGNGLANYIKGSIRAQSIDGGSGNDVLTGGGGGDAFVFRADSGYDLITDFHTGPSANVTIAPDTVRLTGYEQFTTFLQVKAAMTQVGSDVVLRLDADNAIKFADTTISAFTKDNFQLHFDPTQLKASFSDDFNALSLWDGLGGGTWRSDYGWGGDRNASMARTLPGTGEKQLYVDTGLLSKETGLAMGLDPFSVKDGILTIRAAPAAADLVDDLSGYKYTSGLLSTRNSFTQTYGYFEARMEVPAGKGVWPAFWLYTTGSSGSELDVMESHGGDQYGVTTHDLSTGTDVPLSSAVFTPDLSVGFHTYGVMWTSETVTWYLDGVAVKTIPTPPDMHGPMYMLVNLAIDANVQSDFAGADMRVDYVRAYTLDDANALGLTAGNTIGGNTVNGGGSIDYLSGTTAADVLVAGAGNDTYYVDHAGDRIVEKANEGLDTVRAAIDWTLGANLENLTLVGSAISGTGNELNNVIFGNDRNNVLTGGAGNDTLDGKAGADRMIGGTGNDIYVVDNIGDVVVELANEGVDVVTASVDYAISANVENLTLVGTAIRATGNDGANILTGNDLNNILVGGAGSDRLDGGKGADTMSGGLDGDTYVVDNVGDVVIEKANEGWDSINSSVDYTLSANVEQLTLTGTAIRGTAGSAAAFLYGNDRGNVLTGGAGADTIDGKAGNDRIIGGAGRDKLTGGTGADTFVFGLNFGADTITDFKIGEDSIDWSALLLLYGLPKITDVAGNAVATFGTSINSITFTGLRAADLVAAHVFSVLNPLGLAFLEPVIELPVIVLPETAAPVIVPPVVTPPLVTPPVVTAPVVTAPVVTPPVVTLPPVNVTTLTGTSGSDAHIVSAAGTRIVEQLNGGIDTVTASIDYVLSANLENLQLTGSAISATGNELANMLTGNVRDNILIGGAGNDTLIGREGADTMIGGTGNDSYSVDNVEDKIVELANEGTDSVGSSVDYTLTAHVENLTLLGSAIRGTGNDLNNVVVGNDRDNILSGGAGNDRLDGGAGADTLTGGTGDDSYVVDNVRDVVIETAGQGWDVIWSSVDYTTSANIEQLVLTGNAVRGTANTTGSTVIGNELNNVLTGGIGNDTLDGKAGHDTIFGGDGNDRITGGAGNDRMTGGAGKDTYLFAADFGNDVITDFNVREDKIDLSMLSALYRPTISEVDHNAVLHFGSNTITLLGVSADLAQQYHLAA